MDEFIQNLKPDAISFHLNYYKTHKCFDEGELNPKQLSNKPPKTLYAKIAFIKKFKEYIKELADK